MYTRLQIDKAGVVRFCGCSPIYLSNIRFGSPTANALKTSKIVLPMRLQRHPFAYLNLQRWLNITITWSIADTP
jgi:hypothetical protein